MGDRKRGIGFNQLAVVSDCDDAAARVAFWNADGSPLDTCGSATRGVAWQLMRETGLSSLVLRTPRGYLVCSTEANGLITVEMGRPLTGWRDVPLAEALDTLALPLPGAPAACNMGNPHCTFFVDDLGTIDVAALGPAIETHPLFPQKTNVHLVQVIDRTHIRLRIWGARRRRAARFGIVFVRGGRQWHPARAAGCVGAGRMRWRRRDGALGWRR